EGVSATPPRQRGTAARSLPAGLRVRTALDPGWPPRRRRRRPGPTSQSHPTDPPTYGGLRLLGGRRGAEPWMRQGGDLPRCLRGQPCAGPRPGLGSLADCGRGPDPGRAGGGAWKGAGTELGEPRGGIPSEAPGRAKGWQSTPRLLSGALRRVVPSLREVGILVDSPDEKALGAARRQILIRTDPEFSVP